MYDCHIHYYGDEAAPLRILAETSEYASKYMCYHSINFSMIEKESVIDENCCYFMMPFALKELDITAANRRLWEFSNSFSNIMQIPMLGDDMEHYKMFRNLIGFKEHFLHHEMTDVLKRAPYYEYLNSHGKLLLVHCKDTGRLEYIEALRRAYPDMYIQIAHLGVNRKNIEATKPLFSRFAGDDHIFYDVSTVFDFEFIAENYPVVHSQILYGTDDPYISDEQAEKQKEFFENNSWMMDEMNRNADRLLKAVNCRLYRD